MAEVILRWKDRIATGRIVRKGSMYDNKRSEALKQMLIKQETKRMKIRCVSALRNL